MVQRNIIKEEYEGTSPRQVQNLGRWKEPFFPKYGYQRLGAKDLGNGRRGCEMCDLNTRMVHTVRLGKRGHVLHVGPTCARIMCEEDKRFRRFRIFNSWDLTEQEKRFMSIKWQTSRRGLPYLKVQCRGCLFAVLICEGQNKKYSAVIVEETYSGTEVEVIKIGRQMGWHDDIETAKHAAFVWFVINVLDINLYDYLFQRKPSSPMIEKNNNEIIKETPENPTKEKESAKENEE